MLCADCGAPVLRDGGKGRPRKRCQDCYEKRLREKWAAEGDRRRALTGRGDAEVFSKEEVFRRDGWICGICSGPVDQSLQWPHPQSASLDHIVPITRGGRHARENCQCSHLACNTSKQDGDGQQVAGMPLPTQQLQSETRTPLEYMIAVMNDPNASEMRRDRMAVAAAPFVHVRAEVAQEGKKEQRQANAEVSSSAGRFAVPDSPKLVTH